MGDGIMQIISNAKLALTVAGSALAVGAIGGAIAGYTHKSDSFFEAPSTQESRDSIRNALVGLVGGVIVGAAVGKLPFVPPGVASSAILGGIAGAALLGSATMVNNVTS